MAIKTPKDDLILLPKDILSHIKNASADELKTLIYLFAEPDSSASDAAREIGTTVSSVESACAFWRGAGIFTEAAAPKKRVASDTSSYRNYDGDTISKALISDAEFASIYALAGEKLGKQLNKNDISTLYYLFDYVGMPSSLICGIVEHCASIDKRNMQYIFKKAVSLYEDGVTTYEKFENYLARRELINSNLGRLRRLFGMGDRAFTAREKKMTDCWFGDWSMSFELVEHAYEKAVDTTGKLSISYINGILTRWHESGFETVEDVQKGEASRTAGQESSFAGDEFIEAALSRGFDDERVNNET